jgi:hypothetical protein
LLELEDVDSDEEREKVQLMIDRRVDAAEERLEAKTRAE